MIDPDKFNTPFNLTLAFAVEPHHRKAVPEVLHFPDTCGLKFQCKVFLSKGELGKFGSTYRVESVVTQETGILCYKATGEFVLQPNKGRKSKFQGGNVSSNIEVKSHIQGE